MPMVLSGLTKDFIELFPSDEYVAGLWRSTFPQSLLWHTLSWRSYDERYFAPSWSWLSVSCPVKLANMATVSNQHALAYVESVTTTFQYDAPFGPLKSASLTISGVLRRVRMSFKMGDPIQYFELSVFDNEEDRRLIGPSQDDYEGALCSIELDEHLDNPQTECFCLFVAIEQWSDRGSYRDIGCLLLVPVQGENTFRRIGMLNLRDLYALKMRYRLKANLPDDLESEVWQALANRVSRDNYEDVRKSKKKQEQTEQDEQGGEGHDEMMDDVAGSSTKGSQASKTTYGIKARRPDDLNETVVGQKLINMVRQKPNNASRNSTKNQEHSGGDVAAGENVNKSVGNVAGNVDERSRASGVRQKLTYMVKRKQHNAIRNSKKKGQEQTKRGGLAGEDVDDSINDVAGGIKENTSALYQFDAALDDNSLSFFLERLMPQVLTIQ